MLDQWTGEESGKVIGAGINTYSPDLRLLLLGARVGVEAEGGNASLLALLDHMGLSICRGDRAVWVVGSLHHNLVLELWHALVYGRHVGGCRASGALDVGRERLCRRFDVVGVGRTRALSFARRKGKEATLEL